jgi:transporter family protein
MWLLYAFGSAVFAGMTCILVKVGIKNTDSNLATALRTIIVLLFSWLMVFVVGSQHTIGTISARTLYFSFFQALPVHLAIDSSLHLETVNKWLH